MKQRLPDLLPMRPHFREMVWGGRRLESLYGKALPAGKSIGESFEVSAYEGRQSRVASGPLAGWELGALLAGYREELVGEEVWARCRGRFPLLIKLLDAREDLSIQVHPDDGYARRRGLGPWGKMEAWYVLHSQGGRVAHGLEKGMGPGELLRALEAGRVEEGVRFWEVKPGDVVFSPPGTVHALCRGVMVYEVQQSSDLTFRLHDYGRAGLDGRPRALHLAEALEVIDFEFAAAGPQSRPPSFDGVLAEAAPFRLERCTLATGCAEHRTGASFAALTLVEGAVRVRGEKQHWAMRPGDTVLVPAGRRFAVEATGEAPCVYLLAAAAAGAGRRAR